MFKFKRRNMKLKRALVLGLLMIFSVVGLAMGGQNNNRQDRRENRQENRTDRRENRRENRMDRRHNRRQRRQTWRRRRHNRRKHVM
jgi:hypothetical protein